MSSNPIARAYENMVPGDRKRVLLGEYRCGTKKRCLLLHIWQTPQGRCYYIPRYRLSDKVTQAETVESARRKRIEADGRWSPQAASLDQLFEDFEGDLEKVELPVNCEHVRGHLAVTQLAADIDGACPGEPVRKKVFAADRDSGES